MQCRHLAGSPSLLFVPKNGIIVNHNNTSVEINTYTYYTYIYIYLLYIFIN